MEEFKNQNELLMKRLNQIEELNLKATEKAALQLCAILENAREKGVTFEELLNGFKEKNS